MNQKIPKLRVEGPISFTRSNFLSPCGLCPKPA